MTSAEIQPKFNGKLNVYADDTSIFSKDKDTESLVKKTNKDMITLKYLEYLDVLWA